MGVKLQNSQSDPSACVTEDLRYRQPDRRIPRCEVVETCASGSEAKKELTGACGPL